MNLLWEPGYIGGDYHILFDDPPSAPVYLLQSIDGLGDPTVDIQAIKGPYQDGSTFIDAVLDVRMVTLRVAIFGNTAQELQEAKDYLTMAFSPKFGEGRLSWTPYDGITRYLKAIPDGAPSFLPPGPGLGYQLCQIVLRAVDPFWYGEEYEVEVLPNGDSVDVDNNGNAETPVLITLYGPIKDPVIENVGLPSDSSKIVWNGTLGLGDVLVIDTAFGHKSVFRNGENVFAGVGFDTTFWSLAIGANAIKLTGTDTDANTRMSVKWRERFIGT